MSASRTLKMLTLQAFRGLGAFNLIGRSNWRRQRLLILCYHGVSLQDEHEWDPALFMSPQRLEQRCQAIRRQGFQVAPLGEATRALEAGELSEPTVALTFDDGFYDFHRQAAPILSAYRMPATVYLTTYYVDFQRPVFDLVVSYMHWKQRDATENWREAATRISANARDQGLSGPDKNDLARRIAADLGIDYDELLASRILQLMRPEEARELAEQGFDIQLHTHRHRTPLDEELFRHEIRDNRQRIEEITGRSPTHFCYPSGVHEQAFLPWLAAEGVETATTCDPALAASTSNPLLLPRKIDTMGVSEVEFEAWLTGFEPRLRGLTA